MKLRNHIQLRLFAVLSVVMVLWAAFFYQAIVYEINDETDDSLEDYTETIVMRFLRGERLPEQEVSTNNQYFITKVSAKEAAANSSVAYRDSMIYIEEKEETEPARVLITYFSDRTMQFYRLEVFIPTFEKSELKGAIWIWMIILYAVLLLTVLIVNGIVFHISMKPFYHIIRWLQATHVGNKAVLPEASKSITEFNTLHTALEDYARRAEQMYEQQKVFIGEASHEIQTPLAICLNRIEYLLEDTQLTKMQMEELLKMQSTLLRMTRLNRNLLLLSKLDNGQYPVSESVKLNTIIKSLADTFREVYNYLDIVLSIDEQADFAIEMDDVLGTQLVSNLLKNAYVHNCQEHGQIRIIIKKNELSIANTGDADHLDEQLIFQRFFHKGGKAGSSGLGLAIAQAIARKYRCDLSYKYSDGWHFFLLFPKKNEFSDSFQF